MLIPLQAIGEINAIQSKQLADLSQIIATMPEPRKRNDGRSVQTKRTEQL